MAEDYQDRTEQPTPKRRQESREQGQIARSRDLSGALVLLSGLVVLSLWVPQMGHRSLELFQVSLANLQPGSLNPAQMQPLFNKFSLTLAAFLTPILLGLALTSVAANYLQGGWIFAPQRLVPDLNRLQFLSGLKRMFSLNSLVMLANSLAKVAVIGIVIYLTLSQELAALLPLLQQDIGQILLYLNNASYRLSGRILLAFLILGALDFLYQRYQIEKNLRMTKQEVKDEMRQTEGDPKVKARIRSLMRQRVTKRMLAEVSQADVVVTNPTHLAVALKYDSTSMLAPQVVAKGRGFIAQKIVALARDAKVPVLENRLLAQSLFKLVEVGHLIPTSLYRAVAEILAYIYSRKATGGNP
jgi:flagellar biosynthetic protein FlhB